MNANVGFIGAGNMAEAIIRGVLDAKILDMGHLLISDTSQERLSYMKEHYHVASALNEDLVAAVDIVVLAVKPQVFDSILPVLQKSFRSEVCYVSIMAGVTMATLQK